MAISGLVACGGGGSGGTGGSLAAAPEAPVVPEPDPDEATIMLAMGMYDSMAGLKRMVRLDGYGRILAVAPVPLKTTACPGGGSIQTEKVGVTFTLTASNCKLLSTDGLVYDGVWILTNFTNSYAADGSCAGTCLSGNGINHTAARFGYGVADSSVFGNGLQFQTSGIPSPDAFSMAENVPGSGNISYIGSITGDGASASANVSLSASGQAFFTVASTDDRGSLSLSGLLRARVTIGTAGLSAVIDKDQDGVFEKTLNVPWSRFL